MCAALRHSSTADDDNFVRIPNRAQPMGNRNHCPAFHKPLERINNKMFRFGVERRRWFIEQKNRTIANHDASNPDSLPLQAALASAGSFTVGGLIPLLAALLAPPPYVIAITVLASLACLFFLGALSAQAGGARILTAGLRVTGWSALAMAVTAGVGTLVGTLTRG